MFNYLLDRTNQSFILEKTTFGPEMYKEVYSEILKSKKGFLIN